MGFRIYCFICGFNTYSWRVLAEHILANDDGYHNFKKQVKWAKRYKAGFREPTKQEARKKLLES